MDYRVGSNILFNNNSPDNLGKLRGMKDKLKTGLAFIFSGWIFCFIETHYFLLRDGWHYYPVTIEEKVCDIISLLLSVIGWVKVIIAFLDHKRQHEKPTT